MRGSNRQTHDQALKCQTPMNEPLRNEARVWADSLNPNVLGLTPSATVAINDRSNALRREGREIFKLGLGQSPFPVPKSVVHALRDSAGEKDYLPAKGLGALRETVAAHHGRTFGIECGAEDVLIGPGSKELMFLLQLVFNGELVIPSPAWVSYAPQARIIGRHVHMLPTEMQDGWQLRAEQLDQLCRQNGNKPRIVVLNYPSNPTGRTLSEPQLRELAEVARDNRLILLSDEIYGKLHHEGKHQSIVSYYPEGTIFSGGLSKWCGAGGWRLGLFVFPKTLHWLLDAMAAVATETFTSTSGPIQYAAVRAFQGGPDIDRYVFHSRRILRGLGGVLTRRLKQSGAHVLSPQGGFYLFPDFSPLGDKLRAGGIRTSAEMCQRLLDETGVAILPGSDFGRPAEEFTARVAYVDFDGAASLDAAANISTEEELPPEFFRTRCGRVMEAVERLCNWIHSFE